MFEGFLGRESKIAGTTEIRVGAERVRLRRTFALSFVFSLPLARFRFEFDFVGLLFLKFNFLFLVELFFELGLLCENEVVVLITLRAYRSNIEELGTVDLEKVDCLSLNGKNCKKIVVQVHSRVVRERNIVTPECSFVIYNSVLEANKVKSDIFQIGHAGHRVVKCGKVPARRYCTRKRKRVRKRRRFEKRHVREKRCVSGRGRACRRA